MFYAFGSNYSGSEEKMSDFVSNEVACIGWNPTEAQPLHQLMSSINPGDIIFLKSYPPQAGLYIKAIGIAYDTETTFNIPNLGFGKKVKWLWSAENESEYIKMGHLRDKYDNMRNGSIYIECSSIVQKVIIDKIVSLLK